MKIFKYFLPIILSITIISCSSDDDENTPLEVNEVEGLIKVQEITNNTHIIEVFTKSGQFTQGYNEITIRVKDITTNEFVEDATLTWMPMMNMVSMSHSGPRSLLSKVEGMETIYGGSIVFQMPENMDEGWDLTFNYSIDGDEFEANSNISVPASTKQRVTTFMDEQGMRYVVALIAPENPDVMINDIVMGVYKMESMMSFPVVENYMVKLDPRMPSMGNHSSPNNEDLTYDSASNLYKGKLSLTMTGYWKLNLMVLNEAGDVLKGEEVTDTIESSSLYLEIEF